MNTMVLKRIEKDSLRLLFGEVKIDCTKHEGIVTEYDIQIIE
ncbi:MAG: hypothetical protein ACKVH6_13220 [Enterobacterales bacterium]